MSNIINASDINKKNKDSNLYKVTKIKEQLISNDYDFLEIFYNYVEMQDLESAKEIKFDSLKKVVADLSIKFSFDMEGVIDTINGKYAHLLGISYPLFKENLLEWLENKQKVLSNTAIMTDSKNKIGPGDMSTISKLKNSINSMNKLNDSNKILDKSKDFDFSQDVDVNMIILHRSIYLLKRKFEEFENNIKNIYKSYGTQTKVGIEIDTSNFFLVVESIMKDAGFSFTEISRASELLKIEVLEKINQDKVVVILKELKKYMEINREKYNNIIKERRANPDNENNKDKDRDTESKGSKLNKNDRSEMEKDLDNSEGDRKKVKSNESSAEKNSKNSKEKDKLSVKKNDSKDAKDVKDVKDVKDTSKINNSKIKDSKIDSKKDLTAVNKTKNDSKKDNTKPNENKTVDKKDASKVNEKDKKETSKVLTDKEKDKDNKDKDKKDTSNTNKPTNSKLDASKEKDKKEPNKSSKDGDKKTVNNTGKDSLNKDKKDVVSKEKDPKNETKKTLNSPLNADTESKNSKNADKTKLKEKESKPDEKSNNILDTNANLNTNEKNEDLQQDNKLNKENNENNETKQKLYIEVLPLIMADFIQNFPGIVVVDKTPALRTEIKTLFDNEILHRLGENVKNDIEEEKVNKIKELLFEKMNIENNLNVYEDLFLKNRAVGKNTVFIEGMLQKLKMQKIFIEKNIKQLQEVEAETENRYFPMNNLRQLTTDNNNVKVEENKISAAFEFDDQKEKTGYQRKLVSIIKLYYILYTIYYILYIIYCIVLLLINLKALSKEEKRGLAIKEIFHFYAKQHQIIGTTFDEMRDKTSKLDIGEFMKFCVEFRIPCKKEALMELFRKTASNTKHMCYEEFLIALNNLSIKINDDRVGILNDRLKKLDNIGKAPTKTKCDYLSNKNKHSNDRRGRYGIVYNMNRSPEHNDQKETGSNSKNKDKKLPNNTLSVIKEEDTNKSSNKKPDEKDKDKKLKPSDSEKSLIKAKENSDKDKKDAKAKGKESEKVIDSKESKDTKGAKDNKDTKDVKNPKDTKDAKDSTSVKVDDKDKGNKKETDKKVDAKNTKEKDSDVNSKKDDKKADPKVKDSKTTLTKDKEKEKDKSVKPDTATKDKKAVVGKDNSPKSTKSDKLNNANKESSPENNQRDVNPNSNKDKQDIDNNLKNEIEHEKEKTKLLITELKKKTFEDLREELLLYMELDQDKVYRNKMKGFILPFSSEKNYRIPLTERKAMSRLVDPRSAEEIRRIIQKRKEEKLRQEIEKERLMKLKYMEERKKLHQMNENKLKEHDRLQIKDGSTYFEIKQKQINYEREKSNKITWDQLEQLNPEYFVTNKEDDFNPQALLGDINNDSDEEYLNNIVNKRDLTKSGGTKRGTLGKSGFVSSGFSGTNPTGSRFSVSNPNNNAGASPVNASSNANANNNVSSSNNISNTEKKAKEMENQWENQKNKLLSHNDNMIKKGSEVVNKNKK